MNKTAIYITGIIVLGIITITGMYLFASPDSATDQLSDIDTNAVATPATDSTKVVSENTRETKQATGTLSMQNSQFVLSGDPQYKNGLRVKNSPNVKLSAILQIYVDNRQKVTLEGIVESKSPTEMMVLKVAGKQVLTEANAMDFTPRPEDSSVEAFSAFYARLSQDDKNCVVSVFGQTAVQAWINDSSKKPSFEDLQKINACVE